MDKISTEFPKNGHNFGRRPSFSVKIGANDSPECVQSGCRQTLFMNSEFEGSPDPNPMARKKNMVVFWSILEKWGLPGKRGLWQCLGPGPKKNRKKVPHVIVSGKRLLAQCVCPYFQGKRSKESGLLTDFRRASRKSH